jgi:Tol biopolymer transport system component
MFLPNSAQDLNYNQTIQTTGGIAPLAFSISAGVLPANLALNPNTGELSGQHPAGGSYFFTVRVTDSSVPSQAATQSYAMLVLELTGPATLPDGHVGQPYGHSFGVTGHTPPVTFGPAPGTTLPPGLMLDAAGLLSGTPTTTGSFPFCAEVTDSDVPPRSDQLCYFLTVENPAPVITALVPSGVQAGAAAFSLTVQGTGFLPASEVRWNGAPRPTTFVSTAELSAAIPASDVAAAGTPTVTVFNPAPGGGLSNPATFTVSAPPPPGPGPPLLISQSTGGQPSNGDSAISGLYGSLMDISEDGNRVVFSSEGTNLDAPHPGVVVRDVALGITRRVSTTLLDAAPNNLVGESVSISADGLVVAFESRADNHIAGDTGGDSDIFVVRVCIQLGPPVICPSPEWISVMPDGSEPPFGGSNSPSLSADGRFVAFQSNSPLTGAGGGIFVRDRQAGVTTMVSVDDMGNPGGGFFPSISANGRFVAFYSEAPTLVPNDNNNRSDVFVYDTCMGAVSGCTPGPTRVSVQTGGGESSGGDPFELSRPAISPDGRFVAFASTATDLVSGDTNGVADIFLHDRLSGTTTRISSGANPSFNPRISDDGRFVAFESASSLVHDTCFNAPPGCVPSTFGVGGDQPVISGDGRFVARREQSNGVYQIFRVQIN